MSQNFAEWMPSLTASGSAGSESVDNNAVDGNDEIYSSKLDLSLSLFKGGQSTARREKEKNKVLAARAELHNQEQQVLLEAVTNYMDVYKDQKILTFSRQNEKVLKQHLKATKTRFKLGEVTKTDVSQSRSRLAQATSNRIIASGNLTSSKAKFEKITGIPASKKLPKPHNPYQDTQKEEETISQALLHNPLIKLASFNEMASQKNISEQKRAMFPEISFNASSKYQKGGFFSFVFGLAYFGVFGARLI